MRISIQKAAELLNQGGVVAVPTETVYGLAASLHHEKAVEQIFALKGRPANNPLIIHLAQAEELRRYASSLPDGLEMLQKNFWPGPMTLVLPVFADAIASKIRAGLPTAAFRIPMHPKARELLALTGPLVMPSANLSGSPSATSSEHVEADFGKDFPVLDGGPCSKGLESTILLFKTARWCIIRQGALTAEALEPVLGYAPVIEKADVTAPICPGQLYRHYAPKAHLRIAKSIPEDFTGTVLGYDGRHYPRHARVIKLGHLHASEDVAKNLYQNLRQLDLNGVGEALVDFDIPEEGLWQTIRERLLKASQK